MSETEPKRQQSDFMIEKIKERPINKNKLLRRTLITAALAVVFGLVACFTFIALEPVISNWMYPEDPQPQVKFPEDPEEMSPEEMLSSEGLGEHFNSTLDKQLVQQILSEASLDINHYKQLYSTLAQYAQELKRSMVTITGIQSNVDLLNNVQESTNQSSGVFVAGNAKELYILTEYTPIQSAEKLMISPALREDVVIPAEIKAYDTITDLAILSVSPDKMPEEKNAKEGYTIARLGSSNAKNLEGTPVIALGNPMGTPGSVGYGMINAAGGQYSTEDSNYRLLQTDIVGSQKAGGILFNLQGEIIGVITSKGSGYEIKNLIRAYGITDLKGRMEKMSNGEKLAYVGVSGGSVTDAVHEELGIPYGAYVQKVKMDSPAMMAGIKQGDVITMVGGKEIASFEDYTNVLLQSEAGTNVRITVVRQSMDEYKKMTMNVTLGVVK